MFTYFAAIYGLGMLILGFAVDWPHREKRDSLSRRVDRERATGKVWRAIEKPLSQRPQPLGVSCREPVM